MLGVLWHPEEDEADRLIAAFVRECRRGPRRRTLTAGAGLTGRARSAREAGLHGAAGTAAERQRQPARGRAALGREPHARDDAVAAEAQPRGRIFTLYVPFAALIRLTTFPSTENVTERSRDRSRAR